ncbi:hypothetical protein ACHHYP_13503 [Achlya hypogyna]|uniref:DDE Tnp4 domain-containing protein n=1 Tax=Achlya hypogyna TaxID=1202772 RepID=A0A1V9YF70_ACHHY|nr:hypothetical protein ACHHYP_13503 [Achlya hypogyna]
MLVQQLWTSKHDPIHHNARFSIVERVACAIHYATHADGYEATGLVFGMSKSRARVCAREVFLILQLHMDSIIRMPSTVDEWEKTSAKFEDVVGFPNCFGALDESLVPIKRFTEGWYCRKGFTAFNVQALVNADLKFMSVSIRSGSQNDKGVYNNSRLGESAHKWLPGGGCFVADAGYKLFSHVLTPYPIHAGMSTQEAHYN